MIVQESGSFRTDTHAAAINTATAELGASSGPRAATESRA